MIKRSISSRFSAIYIALLTLVWPVLNGPFVCAQTHGSESHTSEVHGSAAHADEHGAPAAHGEAHAAHAAEAEPIGDVIMHHVMDSHDWHFFDLPDGNGGYNPVAIHLPWILYSKSGGLRFFGSSESANADPNYLIDAHDHVHYVKWKKPATISAHEAHAQPEKYAVVGHGSHQTVFEYEADHEAGVMDFSLTKTGLQILLICLVLIFIFIRIAGRYRKNPGKAPSGIQNFFEPVVIFVRDEVAKPFLGAKYEKFTPYLLSLFFFIWFSNMFGLTPLSSNIAGNTSITAALALLTFVLIIMNSTVDFWMHIFWFPGVPIWMKPLMLVVEFMGFLTKPAALAIRLFANISAGHFMVLALICLIFILSNNGESPAGGWAISPLSVLFSLFIMLVEVIVAAVQAFVFSMLTAVFIGQAMEKHEHHDHEHAHEGAAHGHH